MIYFRIILIYLIIISCKVFSQTTGSRTVAVTLPVVALMDIEPTGSFTLNYTPPGEAGNPIVAPESNTTKWINYTSAVAVGGLPRRITASVNQVIPGINIRIQIAAASGSGGGTLGVPTAPITLTNSAQTIISGIRGAFTGNGANNGHRLTISLATNTYANLSARTDTPIVITFTIVE